MEIYTKFVEFNDVLSAGFTAGVKLTTNGGDVDDEIGPDDKTGRRRYRAVVGDRRSHPERISRGPLTRYSVEWIPYSLLAVIKEAGRKPVY